jgi:hypothetical protein
MRNLWFGAVAGAAGLLTISCSDEGMGPLGPSLDPAEAPGLTGEVRIVLPAPGDRVRAASSFLVAAPDRRESPDALWQRSELVAPDRPAGQ